MAENKTKKLTLIHPTISTTLEGQPNCQYCSSTFKDVLLHKDKYLSECNHAYCLACFVELLGLKKNCPICEEPMKIKIRDSQNPNNRFVTKSKVRSSYSMHYESSQGKLKMVKVNNGKGNSFSNVDGNLILSDNISTLSFTKSNDIVISPVTKENDNNYNNYNMNITNIYNDYVNAECPGDHIEMSNQKGAGTILVHP